MENIMVIGSAGQIGIELVLALRARYGASSVIAADIRTPDNEEVTQGGPFVNLNVLNESLLGRLVEKYKVGQIYHLAALLSATSEQHPDKAWDLNMNSMFNVLDLAREKKIHRLFWPSSIAVFGPSTPKVNTPQTAVCEPNTVYGISKLAGERWCEYYFQKYGVDVRSVRYPGLIGHLSAPGGGTTDYAVEIFYHAVEHGTFTSFLGPDTRLPMMYMKDAIRASIELMEAPEDQVIIRSSYNISGLNFTPAELAEAIQKFDPEFKIDYSPDFRQTIADSWPDSIDDSTARKHWGWKQHYNLEKMTSTMYEAILKKNRAESVTFS